MKFGNNRQSRRTYQPGAPFVLPHSKHEVFAGMRRHPEETYRFGSIKGRKANQPPQVGSVKPNPASRFTPSPAFAKADWSKAVQM